MIRDKAQRDVESAIRLADMTIRENREADMLLKGGEKNTNFGRTIAY